MANTSKPAAKPRAAKATSGAAASEAGSGETVQGINVRSFTPTFRRAGVEFTSEGRDFRLDDLSEEQIEAIAAEPMLSVRGVELPASAEDLVALQLAGAADSTEGNA